jgi:serpin B
MHHFDNVRYMENGDIQAVELPYRGDELSMVVLLPRKVDGCGELESRLTPALLSLSLGQMKPQKVEIFLPRFKLESSFDLNDTLVRMGMPEAFGPKADLSGMDGTRLLYISGVFHKAWGEVNEEGTEAAAATAVAVAARAVMKPPPPPPVFRADHPFIFFIRDTRSGSLLFLGRFVDPTH